MSSSGVKPASKRPRIRSPRACQYCNRKKVKCDVNKKNYPSEKCSNCQYMKIDCVLMEKKRKKKKPVYVSKMDVVDPIVNHKANDDHQLSSSDKSKSTTSNSGTEPVNQRISSSSSTDTDPNSFNSDEERNRQEELDGKQEEKSPIIDHFNQDSKEQLQQHKSTKTQTSLSDEPVNVNAQDYFLTEIDKSILPRFSHILNSHSGYRHSLQNYFERAQKVTIGDLISKHGSLMLEAVDCFRLPNEKDCKRYIKSYFENFQLIYPCLTKSKFDKDFEDLTRPKSLVLLLAVLSVGCRLLAEDENELAIARLLYEKAVVVSDANIETNPFYLATSLFILSMMPSMHPSPTTMEDGLRDAIRVACSFGVNKNMDQDSTLSEEDKSSRKRLFWILLVMDTAYALTITKNYNINIRTITVNTLTPADFEDVGADKEASFSTYFYAAELSLFYDKFTKLQQTANISALKCQPYMSWVRELNGLVGQLYDILKDFHTSQLSYDGYLLRLYLYTVDMFVQRVNLFRFYSVLGRAIQTEKVTPGSSHYLELEDLDHSFCWDRSAYAITECIDMIIKFGPGFKPLYAYTQNVLYLMFQMGVDLLPYLFHKDESIRQMAQSGLDKVIPLLDDIAESDLSGLCVS
ncbi:unnamed protein product [Ambrosiozyma monospora]|uniref:Unnamed protein product n=1 Tax=Ambrosiozyma monospora TaxID=43982 RepID=A0ACB5SZ54_AMBMO|nr:unnamed protein product [Ambrosiozyma monospora]